MTEIELKHLLEQAIEITLTQVQQNMSEPLPQQVCFQVENDASKSTYYAVDDIIHYFYKDGSFPRLVDIAVRGIDRDGCILVWLRMSGHSFVQDIADTWNTPSGSGPFKSIGLMLPHSIWIRPRPLSLRDLREAGQWQKFKT